jgi:hypothetical protein
MHTPSPDTLSPAQRSFIAEHHVLPGPLAAGGGAVFVYRANPVGTERWLVDRDGTVREFDYFRRRVARSQ